MKALMGGLVIAVMLSACGGEVPKPPQIGCDLCVHNAGRVDIFVVLESGTRIEDFGIIIPGAGKTIGFGFGSVGQDVTMKWSVGTLNAEQQKASLKLPAPIEGKITLTYLGDGTWTADPQKDP